MEHRLHKVIAKLLENHLPNHARLIVDDASDGKQRIPLFITEEKGNDTRLCCVDALVIVEDTIRLIVEVDESNVIPTQITGKYLTSALANFYLHSSEKGVISKSVNTHFLQIVSTKNMEDKSKKLKQFEFIENAIKAIPSIGNINEYKLFAGTEDDFALNGSLHEPVINYVQQAIQ